MGKGDGCCGANPPREGYAMDWRENSHDMDELVVKIMQQGNNVIFKKQLNIIGFFDDSFFTLT